MNSNQSVLNVYLEEKHIAELSLQQDQLIWTYTDTWKNEGFAVSPHLPLASDIPSINVDRFLRNLLPEGSGFEEMIKTLRVTKNNTFALIRALGLDISGALILSPPQTGLPTSGTFRLISEDEIITHLDARNTNSLIIWDGKPRLSVAGIQDKINIMIDTAGQFGFGEGSYCSTHILKFERQTQSHLVINEYLTMRLAKECGLPVANVTLRQFGKHNALLVERFDRKLINNTHIKRKHVIDGCQALNLSVDYKYERNFGSGRDVKHIRDGASLPLLFNFTNHCQNPVLSKQLILDWVIFNILVCNFDAHAKNISFFIDSHGISIAPFYDLVNIRLYPEVEQEFAMALGDEFDSNSINAYQLADFADSCQLSRAYVARRLKLLINKMMMVLPKELAKIEKTSTNKTYFSEYEKIITERCRHLENQYQDIPKIHL